MIQIPCNSVTTTIPTTVRRSQPVTMPSASIAPTITPGRREEFASGAVELRGAGGVTGVCSHRGEGRHHKFLGNLVVQDCKSSHGVPEQPPRVRSPALVQSHIA